MLSLVNLPSATFQSWQVDMRLVFSTKEDKHSMDPGALLIKRPVSESWMTSMMQTPVSVFFFCSYSLHNNGLNWWWLTSARSHKTVFCFVSTPPYCWELPMSPLQLLLFLSASIFSTAISLAFTCFAISNTPNTLLFTELWNFAKELEAICTTYVMLHALTTAFTMKDSKFGTRVSVILKSLHHCPPTKWSETESESLTPHTDCLRSLTCSETYFPCRCV